MPPSTPSRMVFLASGLMRSTRASPASISTPASRQERGVIWVMAGSCCGRRWKDAESYRKPDAAARQNRRDRRRRSRSAAIQQGISALCRVARMTATSRSAPASGPDTITTGRPGAQCPNRSPHPSPSTWLCRKQWAQPDFTCCALRRLASLILAKYRGGLRIQPPGSRSSAWAGLSTNQCVPSMAGISSPGTGSLKK